MSTSYFDIEASVECDGRIVSRGTNRDDRCRYGGTYTPSSHAEINALHGAMKSTGDRMRSCFETERSPIRRRFKGAYYQVQA